MKRLIWLAALIALTGMMSLAAAAEPQSPSQAPAPKIVQLTPADIKWRPFPGTSGGSFAVVYGNPLKPELYVMLAKYPPNFKAPPHTHPVEQVVTVMEGTLYAGLGESFDPAKLIMYKTGSVFTEPLNTPHFTATKEEGATVVITGIGPHSTKYINSKD